MAISGPSSYVPTINQFIPSWRNLNGLIGGAGLTLKGGYTLPMLVELRTALEADALEVGDKNKDYELYNAEGATLRRLILGVIVQFNRVVRADLVATLYPEVLPKAPSIGVARGTFARLARYVLSLWREINQATIPEFTSPLTLPYNYDLAAYEADYNRLLALFEALDEAELQIRLALSTRNLHQKTAYAIMKKYREVVRSRFKAEEPVVTTMPRLLPLPGSTPAPVEATGAWDEVESKAKLSWQASTDADLQHYEVRWSAGTSYNTKEDICLATIPPSAPRQLLTTQGLALPGAQSVFKVYVVHKSGNECGSNTVKIMRPG